MDFNKLLQPYSMGGTELKRAKRTMFTIIDYLLNKKGYPLEIAGGAIFLVFNYLNSGGEFKGDGSYGSKGKELVTSIRIKCDDLLKERLEGENAKAFLEYYGKDLRYYIIPSWKRKFFHWWYGRDIFK